MKTLTIKQVEVIVEWFSNTRVPEKQEIFDALSTNFDLYQKAAEAGFGDIFKSILEEGRQWDIHDINNPLRKLTFDVYDELRVVYAIRKVNLLSSKGDALKDIIANRESLGENLAQRVFLGCKFGVQELWSYLDKIEFSNA